MQLIMKVGFFCREQLVQEDMPASAEGVLVHHHCFNHLQSTVSVLTNAHPVTFFNKKMAMSLAWLGSFSASGNISTLMSN